MRGLFLSVGGREVRVHLQASCPRQPRRRAGLLMLPSQLTSTNTRKNMAAEALLAPPAITEEQLRNQHRQDRLLAK